MSKSKKKDSTVKKNNDNVTEELKGQLARALADYDNLRKRVERERDKFLQFANKGLIARFLTIYDMLESAQTHINDSGIAIILEEFKTILWDENVEKINVSKGDSFDEEFYDAVEVVEEGKKGQEGKVAEVVLSGWKYKDGTVIRPSKVKVYKT